MSEQKQWTPKGEPIALDENADSAAAGLPAFLAKPSGAPVYHGFRVLTDVVVEGFTLGMITDFEAAPTDVGDAFVIAPDNSRAGLVWEVSETQTFEQVCAETDGRWGVWAVAFPTRMTSRENARRNLAAILPYLKPKWETWRRDREVTQTDERERT